MPIEQALVFAYRLLCQLWQKRYLVVIPAVVTGLVLALHAFSGKAKYQSQTSLLLQESALSNPFLKDLSVSVRLKERLDGLRALLHSRYVMAEVAGAAGLTSDDMAEGQKEAVYRRLAGATHLHLSGDSLVTIGLLWDTPEQARHLLTLISASFQQRLMDPGQRAVDNSERFLSEQLALQETSLADVEGELARFKQEHANLLPNLLGANNMALLEAEAQIRSKLVELEGARAQLVQLKGQLKMANPIVSEIEKQIVSTRAQLALLKSRYTDRHSQVKGVKARLAQLQQEKQRLLQETAAEEDRHLEELWQLATTFKPEEGDSQAPLLVSQLQSLQESSNLVVTLEGELKVLEAHKASILERMGRSAEVEQQLAELERLAEGKRSLYSELLERYEKARVTGQLGRFEAPEKVRVIDRPNLPSGAIGAPWWLMGVLGLFGGAGLGVALAVLGLLLDRKIYRQEQIERLSGAPVLAEYTIEGEG
ncbi:hypothetical protein [Ferrimonas sp. YFM]|uniref:hypothetical protein n=1 Tax=Ferrimonas sp. YFM TaxID=3028878 RepID=UPI002572F09E|nr:hypothetical protein [Ferrimonas sp. YFM]BDY04926.1 chain-length determining protein [Ferrimonas sp. YFM]